jgi:MFS family permease
MEQLWSALKHPGMFGWIYLSTALYAFHMYVVHLLHSSVLEEYLPVSHVGWFIALASTLTILLLFSIAVPLQRYGNVRVALTICLINFCTTLAIVFVADIALKFTLLALHICLTPLLLLSLDVFMEQTVQEENNTGTLRGLFLLVLTLGVVLAPPFSTFLVGTENRYEHAYLASALFLVPLMLFIGFGLRRFIDPKYTVFSAPAIVRALLQNANLFHVSMAQFLMRIMFSCSVVYLPIYLHQKIGFSWPEIGVIIFWMVLPYVLIEFPAGIFADKITGEKEMLITGFLIAGITTISLSFLTIPNVFMWSLVLFISRVGGALIESMTESYFFKQVNGSDVSVLSLFRILHPLAFVLGPLCAGALLLYLPDMAYLWGILGGVVLIGIYHALQLHDTK